MPYPGGTVVRVKPTVIAGTTHDNDVMFDSTEIPGAVSNRGGISKLVGMTIIDKDQESHDMELIFTENQVNFGTLDEKGNFVGATGYDPNFAKAVTRENQQAQGTDGGGDGTYICTALYDMGDMRAYIYKYDQLYGRKVNPNIYRGYCLWGKYVATKMKRQGWTYRIVKPIALAWAKQMAFDLSKGRHGKKNTVVKVISKIGEGICYALGFVANLKNKKGVKYG